MFGERQPFRPVETQFAAAPVPEGVTAPTDMSGVFNFLGGSYGAVWLWIDLETSGLDPHSPNFGILEIAAVVTDDDLSVVDQFHVIVNQPERVISNASKWCHEHFGPRHLGGNDLFNQCRASAITESSAGEMLRDFIVKHSVARRKRTVVDDDPKRQFFEQAEFNNLSKEPKKVFPSQHDVYRVMCAGCSVYFDRGVLLARYPHLQNLIGHKTIDCSSILEVVRKFRPDLLATLQSPQRTHRALVDTFEALTILKWFYANIMMNTR
jgi:oligoribonuclease